MSEDAYSHFKEWSNVEIAAEIKARIADLNELVARVAKERELVVVYQLEAIDERGHLPKINPTISEEL